MRVKLIVLAVLALQFTNTVQAGETDAFFDLEGNRIVMPHLIVGDETYFVTLNVTDAATLTFQADVDSITDFTPPDGIGTLVNTDATAIIGHWILPGGSTDEFFVLFRNNGTYSYFLAQDDQNCVAGEETGTYSWAPSTGVLITTQTSDPNGSCGLSDPSDGVPFRIFIDGNTMQLLERGGGEPLDSFGFERAP